MGTFRRSASDHLASSLVCGRPGQRAKPLCQLDRQPWLYAHKSAFGTHGARELWAPATRKLPHARRAKPRNVRSHAARPNASWCCTTHARFLPLVEHKSATTEPTASVLYNHTVPPAFPHPRLLTPLLPNPPIDSQARKLILQRKFVMAPRVTLLLLAVAVFFASASAQDFTTPSSAAAPAPDAGAAARVSAVAMVSSAMVSLLAAAMMQ